MNKNKIIFGILGAIIVFLVLLGVYYINQSTSNAKKTGVKGSLNIWILRDEGEKFGQIISDFKSKNPTYTNTSISVETFSNEKEYFLALASAFINGKAPDVFVMQSDEI
ncbi:MAG TPA: hypothetical protein PKC87_06220, partial [Candidatus Absconditabacterales bacterium]|nr:hypothetical protein [Candidatus Absconditabacterales bacterium]